MERMIKMRRALAALGLLAAVALLLTCSNPFDLLGVLETEVKIGTGKFLIVESVTPEANEFDVNPGAYIVIVFSQALDATTINSTNITITPTLGGPAAGWNHDYSAATRTLQIHADPYLENTTKYAVQIGSGLKGASGSELQCPYTWEFTTGTYPAGTVSFNETDPYSDDPATTSRNVTLYFTGNSVVDNYRYSLISAENLATLAYDQSGASQPYVLPDLDGAYTVWAQWIDKDPAPDQESTVQFDTIFLDRVAPTVDAGTTRYLNLANYTTGVYPVVTATDATSGIETYLWSGASLSFSSTAVKTPLITAAADGTYTATLRATDYAGLFAQDTVSIVRDTVPPAYPVFDQLGMSYLAIEKYRNTVDPTPTWRWASGDGTGPYDGTDIFSLLLKDSNGKSLDEKKEWEDTSYTFKDAFRDGYEYTLTVTERDPAGNASSRSWPFLISPMVPFHRAEGVPLDMFFQWRRYHEKAHHYSLFLNGKLLAESIPIAADTYTKYAYTLKIPGEYEWFYEEYDSKGVRTYRSERFTFATVK